MKKLVYVLLAASLVAIIVGVLIGYREAVHGSHSIWGLHDRQPYRCMD